MVQGLYRDYVLPYSLLASSKLAIISGCRDLIWVLVAKVQTAYS